MRYLGIDYGTKRVGVALSDEEGKIAFPHAVYASDEKLLSEIARLVEENDIENVVIGESKDYSGEDNPLMGDIIAFAKNLKEIVPVKVVFEPEVLTSAAARRQFESAEVRSRKEKKVRLVDASAAALILQAYLDKENNI
jgi:putative holliday junction resolvase